MEIPKYHAQLVRPGPISFRTSQKLLFTCPGTSFEKVKTILYFIFDNYMFDELTRGENSVDPDQLAADLDLHCFQ